MGQQRIRRKRRRGFQKYDAVIVTLSSLTVILLLVWGGLYWMESSERALIVNANGAEHDEQALQEDEGLQTADSEDINAELDEQPSLSGEMNVPEQQMEEKPHVTGGGSPIPDASDPVQETITKPDAQNPVKSESPSTNETNPPSTKQTSPPSTKQTDPPKSQSQKYEQEIIQVQASCTNDMNAILSGAESSLKQLDRTDPAAIQVWNKKLTMELAAAESKCDGTFQEVTKNAEKDSVSPKAIEEWNQTFIALKDQLRVESRAKLEQLIEG